MVRISGNYRTVSQEGYDMLMKKLTFLVCLVFVGSSFNRTAILERLVTTQAIR